MSNFDAYNLYSANSCKPATILFLLVGLLFIGRFPFVISEIRTYKCNTVSANAETVTFWENLVILMNDLVMNASQTGFCTSSYGQSPNIIYGLLQCSEDISRQDCSSCSRDALHGLMQFCGNTTGGQLWLDKCFLRSDNSSFFSTLDTNGTYVVNAVDISTSDVYSFTNATVNLLSNLSSKVYVHAEKRFAEGSAAYSSLGTVYGQVQCWRDVSNKDCRSCLQLAMSNLYGCCSMKQGGQALLGSCTVRYEIYPFFDTSTGSNTSTSPPVKPPKGAAQTPRPNGTNGSPKSIHIILGIVGGVLLALLICLFAMRRKLKSAISARPVIRAQNEEIHENYSESTLLKQKQILFTLEALIESTDNFHESNKLGGGGFGSVYKVTCIKKVTENYKSKK